LGYRKIGQPEYSATKNMRVGKKGNKVNVRDDGNKKGNGKMGNGSWATEKLGDEKWAGRKKNNPKYCKCPEYSDNPTFRCRFFQLPFLPLPFLP